ncbi:MAG TPA: tripartite tricarboxylate transporter substrate binding protein [Ramlibacter sp.]|uniref:Bug family tripartite tricarboxylate transporter substrate binding protein n=1 Tax=Ramlibacter sp. TaxID=1917967 RepID=UPI002ED69B66
MLKRLTLTVCGLLAAAGAVADPYPAKPITLVVPYSAGGGADVIARALGKSLTEQLKQPVVVDNKPGASGQIAAAAVSRATPDGYTLLLSTDNMYSINPVLFGKAAQESLGGLEPIANIVGAPVVVAVSASSPIQGLQDFAAAAQKKGAPLSYASPGVGTPHQLAAEMLARALKQPLTHVPYKGTSNAMTDLVGGQVDLLFGMPASVQPLVTAGKARIIAVTSPSRFPLLPTVPTVAETLRNVSISTVDMGLMTPKGTSPDIVRKLNDAVRAALVDRDVRHVILTNGMVGLGGSPADYAQRMKQARAERERIIVDTGIRAE